MTLVATDFVFLLVLLERRPLISVRMVISAREADSSVGGVPVGYCPDDGHMEEEVQLKVQVDEEKIGEKHAKEQDELSRRVRANLQRGNQAREVAHATTQTVREHRVAGLPVEEDFSSL